MERVELAVLPTARPSRFVPTSLQHGLVINWEHVDAARTERAIQALLRRLHPGLRSLDGAGGDGGRDAQVTTPDGLTVFEVKSFGRLNGSRRRQVESSLRAAVTSNPTMTHWVLVVPMNMTPRRKGAVSSEEAWFEGRLAQIAPGVELMWRGQDWLDGRFAQHQDLQRYVEGADAQLLQRASIFDREASVMAHGAADLHERLRGLGTVVNEVSPFWTLDFFSHNGVQGTMLRGKVPDAHEVDPITITPTVSFAVGDPEAENLLAQLDRTLSFGGRVVLPAGYVASIEVSASPEARLLIPEHDPTTAEFTLVSGREELTTRIRCSYQALVDGEVVAQFPVYLAERTSGSVGATLYGSDAAGIVAFSIRLPRPDFDSNSASENSDGAGLELDLEHDAAGFDLDDLLPVLEVLSALTVDGAEMRFDMPGLGFLGGPMNGRTPYPNAPALLQVVRDLRRIEELDGRVVRLPANMTNGDVRDLRTTVRNLDGETVEVDGTVTVSLRAGSTPGFVETLQLDGNDTAAGGLLIATSELALTLGDLEANVGPAALWLPRPRLADRPGLLARARGRASDAEVTARLEPGDHSFQRMSRTRAIEYLAAQPAAVLDEGD